MVFPLRPRSEVRSVKCEGSTGRAGVKGEGTGRRRARWTASREARRDGRGTRQCFRPYGFAALNERKHGTDTHSPIRAGSQREGGCATTLRQTPTSWRLWCHPGRTVGQADRGTAYSSGTGGSRTAPTTARRRVSKITWPQTPRPRHPCALATAFGSRHAFAAKAWHRSGTGGSRTALRRRAPVRTPRCAGAGVGSRRGCWPCR